MRLAVIFTLVGCGTPSGGGGPNDAPLAHDAPAVQMDAPANAFVLTSAALTEGGTFATANTCDGPNNDSPPLAWDHAPLATQSFALVLTDTTIALTHSVIYDIPAATVMLPPALAKVYAPAVPAGTHEAPSIDDTPGYSGPCPPQGQAAHVYELALYALDVATLPGTTMTTTRAMLTPLVAQHMIAKATLTASYAR